MSYRERFHLEHAPKWAEASAPRNLLAKPLPGILLLGLPSGEGWSVASLEEIAAVCDPASFLGRVLRQHSALMSLPYISDN